jgi:hypothetical protein
MNIKVAFAGALPPHVKGGADGGTIYIQTRFKGSGAAGDEEETRFRGGGGPAAGDEETEA